MDEEFEAALTFPDLVAEYRAELRKEEQATRKRHMANRDDLKKLKLAGLENERLHRDLLNLCAYPFTATGRGSRELQLHFVRGSPLAELGAPNFDILIARLEPPEKPAYLLAIEGKSSVGQPHHVVNEVLKKRQAFMDNIQHVMVNYLGQPSNRAYTLEAVVAVDSVDAPNMVNAIVAAKEGIRTWHGQTTGPETLSLAAPPLATPNRHLYLHADPALNSLLNKLPSVRRAFDVWPMTHPLIELGALVTAAHPVENGMSVTPSFLDAVLSKDMFYLSPAERTLVAQRLIEQGKKISFLETTDLAGEFRIVAKGLSRENLELTLQEKWVKSKLDDDLDHEMESCKKRVQNSFSSKRAERKGIDDF